MRINKSSCLHPWEVIISNYNKKRKTIPYHNTFWEIIMPIYSTVRKNNLLLQQTTQVKLSSFHIGRKVFPTSQPVSNLNMCHLQKVDASLGDRNEIRENLHSYRKVKCLQIYSKTLWMNI